MERTASAHPPSVPKRHKTRLPHGRLSVERVLDLLIADGLLAADEATRARATARETKVDVHPLVLLANLKLPGLKPPGVELSLERLTEWLAQETGLAYVRIDPTKVDVPAVTALVSQAYAQRYRFLPLEVGTEVVRIATSEPLATDWLGDVARLLRKDIELAVVNPLDLNRYTMEFFGVTRSVRGARDARDAKDANAGMPNFEQLVELGRAGELGADDRHVVHIVDWLLQYAYEQRASDIHLEPRREVSRVRFRIDGVMHKVYELPSPVMNAVTARIKVLGRMDLAERRRPQDGRIKTRSPGGREVEMRLSTMPTAFGEKTVMRIFDPDTAFKSLEQLGFDPSEAAAWNELVERPHGIVLVTGPTGSGKTTTLYSALRRLATMDVNVCTVEDPIEMLAPELNQMQVHPQIDLTFATGVRTLLRQDPDIIMIGEIRDLDTAQMAVQASLTGHLVLSTLHTNDAPSAITRLLDLGVPHYLIASTLNGVLAQRLVRTLCPHCKQPVPADADGWQALEDPHDPLPLPATGTFGPVGCLECRNTGYLGRTGLYELLVLDPGLRRLITADMELDGFTRAAVGRGMHTLRGTGMRKVAAGLTTVAEVLTTLPPRD
ncbi:MAG: Flp pilus assembly complex ATPase component TadA [Proteobacteria bacterium]|nr:Flp pilus assembly complex ATPase component TadA [Pseudomonadota bacterium]